MKRILLLAALLFTAPAFAQFVPEWHQGELSRKGTRLAVSDVKLDREATLALVSRAGGPDLAASWERASAERGWGIGLTAGGYTLAAAGFCFGGVYLIGGVFASMFAAIGGQQAVDGVWAELGPMVKIGTVGFFTGLAAGTTGVVLLCVGNGQLRKITDACNAAGLPPVSGAELAFGPAPSGIGFTLRF